MLLSLVALTTIFATACADSKPISYDKLPAAAKTFVSTNYSQARPVLTTVDDDFFRPDYEVRLDNGVKVEFYNNGSLKSIEDRNGIPAGVVPGKIVDYVKANYSDATTIIEFDSDKRSYEVKLSNRLELKFTKDFQLIKIDD